MAQFAGTSRNAEHGTDLWPSTFQNLDVKAQINIGTQLSRQSTFLQGRPFIHSASNLNKIVDRLNKDDDDEEFGWSLSFDPLFISQLAIQGFLPMAGQCFADLICLLPKLHKNRCLMLSIKDDLKVPRGALKRSHKFEVTVDQAFEEVIAAIQVQHGQTCWFYAPLTQAYRDIHAQNSDLRVFGIRIHSIELWQSEVLAKDGGVVSGRRLVAGELGYSVGGCYTSLSGFRAPDADGAGTVQCCAVAVLLEQCGFNMWDLGMGMTYKYDLGAKDVPRDEFLHNLELGKGESCVLRLEGSEPASGLLKRHAACRTDPIGGVAVQTHHEQSEQLSKRQQKVLAEKIKRVSK